MNANEQLALFTLARCLTNQYGLCEVSAAARKQLIGDATERYGITAEEWKTVWSILGRFIEDYIKEVKPTPERIKEWSFRRDSGQDLWDRVTHLISLCGDWHPHYCWLPAVRITRAMFGIQPVFPERLNRYYTTLEYGVGESTGAEGAYDIWITTSDWLIPASEVERRIQKGMPTDSMSLVRHSRYRCSSCGKRGSMLASVKKHHPHETGWLHLCGECYQSVAFLRRNDGEFRGEWIFPEDSFDEWFKRRSKDPVDAPFVRVGSPYRFDEPVVKPTYGRIPPLDEAALSFELCQRLKFNQYATLFTAMDLSYYTEGIGDNDIDVSSSEGDEVFFGLPETLFDYLTN